MRIATALRSIVLVIGLIGSTALAHNPACEVHLGSARPLTPRLLREQSKARIQRVEVHSPRPHFDNLEIESQIEQVGEAGPQSVMETLGRGASLVSSPEPTSADLVTVGLMDEVRSMPVHMTLDWHGRRSTSTVFASLPHVSRKSDFLVGPEYPAVLLHLHGGGTPSATGKNGVNIGERLMGKGIPVLAPTLPGHGRATRNPEGLMSMREQAEWLMALINEMVHPGVKVILSGHSWGGMFAAYMHRHSDQLPFSRISRFISLSPGVDTSMGGSAEERVAFDQWWEKNYPSFKEKIAPADFEFQENVLSNGKEADIPSYFTGLSNLDCSTPPLTPEVMRNLKPLTVIVGSADGVVYVGREEIFQRIFGQLSGESEFIVLGAGRTWKSTTPDQLIETGHNIFDRYIDGTTTYQVYSKLSDLVEKAAGHAFPEVKGDRVEDVVDHIRRHYANFFAFRELVDHQVEYVTVPTPELAKISARKVGLDDYLRKVEDRRGKSKKMSEDSVNKALADLRAELGLSDPISVERAKAELSMPQRTEARKAELERFIGAVDQMDLELKAEFTDSEAEAEFEKLKSEFSSVLDKIGATDIKDYEPHLESLNKTKPKGGDQERLRSDLSRLHQKFAVILKAKQHRYSVERDARLAAIRLPSGVADFRSALRELRADQSPERRHALESFVARAGAVESAARANAEFETAQAIEALPKPQGLTSVGRARELQVETDQRLRSIFVPREAPEAVRNAANQIVQLEEKFVSAYQGSASGEMSLDKLETLVGELRDKRIQLTKRWEALWKKGVLNSERLKKAQLAYEHTLASFKEIYYSYEEMKSARLLELKDRGELTAAAVVAQTPELLRARHRYQHAKKVFLDARDKRDEILFDEAASGALEGPANAVKDAMKIASELGPTSELYRAREDHLDVLRQRLSVLQKQNEEQKYLYALAMKAAGFETPYTFARFHIYEELNRPYDVVIRDLRSNPALLEAMTKVLSRWDGFLSEFRRENASSARNDGGY